MNKQVIYEKLVQEVCACEKCDGITPDAQGTKLEHFREGKHVNLWSYWQGNLSPEILLIGQDWGKLPATADVSLWANGVTYPIASKTNENLICIFKHTFGIDISTPQSQKLFFTNSVFCYKTGSLSAKTSNQWFNNCNQLFMRRLIKILNPRVIIALGKKATFGLKSCRKLLLSDGTETRLHQTLKSLVESPEPLYYTDDDLRIPLFPMYHCGVYGAIINRPREKQLRDWERVKPFVNL